MEQRKKLELFFFWDNLEHLQETPHIWGLANLMFKGVVLQW